VGYKTKCRFFRDSDVEDEITWYPALPDAPLLGVPTVFASLRHEPKDFYWLPGGEVPYKPFTVQKPATKTGALGVHHCGTDTDFREGCQFLPDDPPVSYQTNGLPDCCGAAPTLRGGGAGGGRVGVVVTPPTLVPDANCVTAPTAALDITYTVQIQNDLTVRFFELPVIAGKTYRMTVTMPTFTNLINVFEGARCTAASFVGGIVAPGHVDMLAAGNDLFEFNVFPNNLAPAPFNITVRLHQLP